MNRRRILIAATVLVALLGGAVYAVWGVGRHEGPGVVTAAELPDAVREARDAAHGGSVGDVILFGDLHVHTTFSADAFMRSLPLVGGEGAHPPADACDYARFCSQLDFFAYTDHAESLTHRHWIETQQSARQCAQVAGGDEDADVVPFMGFEWSQVGLSADTHYGHRNVIFPGLGEDALPARPIASAGIVAQTLNNSGVSGWQRLTVPLREFPNHSRYLDFDVYQRELAQMNACPEGVPTTELPPDCQEVAPTPRELFAKLDEWGLEALVIPHGTTWGFYTPPGYESGTQAHSVRDAREQLIEVYSGHGNSEEYRAWRHVGYDENGEPFCPEPVDGFEPCCWRAGEIIRARCGDIDAAECEARVSEARANHLAAGVAGHQTIPGTTPEDWGRCGQCDDCFNPAFNYRPGGSVQAWLARSKFADDGTAEPGVFGLIGSSDNHSARPGTGYREHERRRLTEATGPRAPEWREFLVGETPEPSAVSVPFDPEDPGQIAPFLVLDLERQASFFMTGGLVAVHAEGRSREAIWEALQRREVYATSGDRILLWFDAELDGAEVAMGGAVSASRSPVFHARALGAQVQASGCPDGIEAALGEERLQALCMGECFYPTDERIPIDRIEVVRIRPQMRPDEPLEALIEDPWRVFPCDDTGDGCEATFSDDEFGALARPATYYVRAIQAPTPAVNAEGIRCLDPACEQVEVCWGDWRTDFADDCLADNEERAWSSPIFVSWEPPSIEEGSR